MRSFLILLGAFVVTVRGIAPIIGVEHAKAISGSYIVVLKNSTSSEAFASHMQRANAVLRTNSNGVAPKIFDFGTFKGYTIKGSKEEVATLADNDDIAYIEADRTVTLPPVTKGLASRDVQANAPWNLARISHREKGSTEYVSTPAPGTYVYVLDTGVRISHPLFEGRASFGFNAVQDGSIDDLNGHGTHVAGIVAGQTYGVNRYTGIVAVRVLDASGSSSSSIVISGVNWTVQDIKQRNRVGKATAAFPIGGSNSAALDSAIAAASNAGVMFAVAAGGDNADVGTRSPASEPTSCTVGGTTIDDARMSSSNYGPAVDIFAPGQNIRSLWISGGTSTNVLSGTSMAAAHIAGLGAYFLALEGPRGATALCTRLQAVATRDALTGIPSGTLNYLAYNLSGL